MRSQRGFVLIELEHAVLAAFVLAQRVELVARLVLPHFGCERKHDSLELRFLAGGDIELRDQRYHRPFLLNWFRAWRRAAMILHGPTRLAGCAHRLSRATSRRARRRRSVRRTGESKASLLR